MMNKLRRIFTSFFPMSRRAIRWRDAWPLIVFLIVFGVACFGLEYGHYLMFARPIMLGLIVFAPWIWWMHVAGYAGLPRGRATVALLTRLTLLGLLSMVLAEPRSVKTMDVMSIVFALDVSDSIYSPDDALNYVVQTVQNQRPKGKSDQAGLIIFGKTPACELSPSMSFPFEAFNSQVDRGATNIEQTLSYAGALLPEDYQGKVVLISDGVQTEGNLSRILDDLKGRGVVVDVLPIDYSYSNEVWLERLDLPQGVKLGETYEAGMLVKSLNDGKGKLVLRENGNVIAEQEVEYKEGTNRYTVPITLRTAGYYEYTASIEVPKAQDSLPQNNTVLNYVFVEGEGKVLLVTDGSGDRRDWELLEKRSAMVNERLSGLTVWTCPVMQRR
ncbi:vWA domain-containing protein [Schlesneria sp.]|uniref:vWA domain-containing protein n=1 Tax=Schlesneria sp. TaxID=2762018 RepID=UPI002F11F227